MKATKHSGHQQRAAVTMWVALTFLVLVAMAGLALDTGSAVLFATQLQAGADAAALAGAQWVRSDVVLARQEAADTALANSAANAAILLTPNDANLADGDIVIGRYDRDIRVFTATLNAPNAMKIVARRTASSPGGSLPMLFGPIFGVPSFDLSRYAIAMVGGATGAGLIVLDPSAQCAFDVRGTFWLDVAGGAIQVNSAAACAACGNGTPLLETPELNITGVPGACFVGGVEVTGSINPGTPPVPDPLAYLPEPTWDPMADLGAIVMDDGQRTLQPGYYSGGILQTGGLLTLQPGIYVLDGTGLQVGGNASFIADGVTLYIIGTGYVDITGTGIIRITPPDPDVDTFPGADIYEGVSIFQARNNTNPSRIIGTSTLDLQGTLYFPSAPLQIGGIGGDFGNQLIVNKLLLRGTGQIRIGYDGRLNAPGNNLFLVE